MKRSALSSRRKLAEETKVISTDEHGGYVGDADDNTIHVSVRHRDKQYVQGLAHTNTLENVWSLFKRSIVGPYHQLSMKHLDRYLDEFELDLITATTPSYSAIRY